MGGVAGHAGLFSTAEHDMSLFCQALLDKLSKTPAPSPSTQSTLQQATSPSSQPPPVGVPRSSAGPPSSSQDGTPSSPATPPISRGLKAGTSTPPHSRPRGKTIFPITTAGYSKPRGTSSPGSFGHTGFTGTSLWIDPTSNTYVILLANAIHPRGGAPISQPPRRKSPPPPPKLGLCTGHSGCPILGAASSRRVGYRANRGPPSNFASGVETQTRSSSPLQRSANTQSNHPAKARPLPGYNSPGASSSASFICDRVGYRCQPGSPLERLARRGADAQVPLSSPQRPKPLAPPPQTPPGRPPSPSGPCSRGHSKRPPDPCDQFGGPPLQLKPASHTASSDQTVNRHRRPRTTNYAP